MGPTTRTTALIALLATALALTGCTQGGDHVLHGDGSESVDAAAMALDNAFATESVELSRAMLDDLHLDVEYFEPLRKGDWVAPDHCTFSTRLTVNATLSSPGFDGPSSDSDTQAGDGVLVGTLSGTVSDAADPAARPEQGPSTTNDAHGGGLDSDASEPDGSQEPTEVTEPHESEDPSWQLVPRPALLAVAAVFGHGQVVELSSDHPAVIEGHGLDAQPVDGWNLLRLGLDPEAQLGDLVPATLRRIAADGSETTLELEIPVGERSLQLVGDEWRFDLGGIDDRCRVPDGSPDNRPLEPGTDILGSPVGDAPDLPDPGRSPEDPAAASDEALRSLRALYDLEDIWATSKREHLENPEDWDVMRRQLLANDVVAPFMSNLAPEFRSLVFVSPTEVHVLYRVGPSYHWEIGRVLLIDGRWRVAAGTVCRDLAAAGYRCPGVVNDPRPGPLG